MGENQTQDFNILLLIMRYFVGIGLKIIINNLKKYIFFTVAALHTQVQTFVVTCFTTALLP